MGKYKGLLDDIREKQAGGAEAPAEASTPSPALSSLAAEMPARSVERRKPGRPKGGKSSNPDFVQTTAYVEKVVHTAVQKELLDMKPTDYSDLVNDLLKKWLKSRR
jgi:hypothetical protein